MWDLVGNPEDRFSQNEAHIVVSSLQSTLVAFNNMLLVGIGDEALCTQLVDFCTGCLATGTSSEICAVS